VEDGIVTIFTIEEANASSYTQALYHASLCPQNVLDSNGVSTNASALSTQLKLERVTQQEKAILIQSTHILHTDTHTPILYVFK